MLRRLKLPTVLFILSYAAPAFAQSGSDTLLYGILQRYSDSLGKAVLGDPGTYRYQLLYPQINRDRHNQPHFTDYFCHTDSLEYFNPASTVKLPLALLALEKLRKLHIPGVNKYTRVVFDSSSEGETAAYRDSTSPSGFPSIAQYIKKAFLISDNDAYNRLYAFTGQQTINRRLHQMGYRDVRITRQFAPLSLQENRSTNAVRFIRKNGKLIYRQPPACNTDSFDFSHTILLGRAHMNDRDSLVNSPFDFTRQNNISLKDLQQLLQAALFPLSVPEQKRFALNRKDHRFLLRYLSQYPSETDFPRYDTSVYYDSYVKFFFRAGGHSIPDYIRIFNKVGWSYGFLTDVAYIVDFKHRVEFMLAATVYVNSNQVINDNTYDYEKTGFPFLYEAGQAVYHYELSRQRSCRPRLGAFKIKYGHRNPRDKRPVIRSAAN